MVVFDFNSFIDFGQVTFGKILKGLANAHRTNSFLTTDRLPAKTSVRQMRSLIPRQLSDKNFLMFRSIPVYGLCPDNISTESSRPQNLSFFVTRARSNFDYSRLYYRKVNKTTGFRCDQTIRLNGCYASQDYPAVLRRISCFDAETNPPSCFRKKAGGLLFNL